MILHCLNYEDMSSVPIIPNVLIMLVCKLVKCPCNPHTHTHTHTLLMSFLMFIIYKFTKCITKVVIEQLATSSKMNGSLLPLLVKTIYFLNCNPVRFISNQQMAHFYT